MDRHLGADLSAYLDDELDAPARAAAEAHLGACGTCRARLGELRATARLIAALPLTAPSRSLVPRVAVAPNWLRPLRSLSAVATGAFVFLLIASTVLETGARFGGGGAPTAATAPGAAQGERGFGPILGSPAPDVATRAASGAATATPPALAAPVPATATEKTAADSARQETAAPAPTLALTTPPSDAVALESRPVEKPQLGPPALWLALALAAALAAILAHRRIRSV
jgi:hypothetical protein